MERLVQGNQEESPPIIGLEYWVRWQVPVCALIFILPTLVAVRFLLQLHHTNKNKKKNNIYIDDDDDDPSPPPLKSAHMWVPCWRNLNPIWLLIFRAFAFASMAFILYHILLLLGGAFAFYFYTQWTLGLVTVYFALATIISARGCWVYSKKPYPENRESDEFLKKDSEAKEMKGTVKFPSRYSQDENAGFFEHLVLATYQTCAGAVMLTDIVFWGLLFPFLMDDKFKLTPLIVSLHSVNAVFLILDTALNSQPFSWSGLAYFVLWSVSYIVFQWILHACGFNWWPYPFLELATPWAPLWYFALALVHLPCYGIYVLLVKAKPSIFSRIFPYAFVRTSNTTRRNSLEKKQT